MNEQINSSKSNENFFVNSSKVVETVKQKMVRKFDEFVEIVDLGVVRIGSVKTLDKLFV